tara:strand:- start:463 stop:624 length:162 start_codon:yes stop_codon:yes gene_type:complete
MNKIIAKKIDEIKKKEKLSTAEVFQKYPHLADLLVDEQKTEQRHLREKQLLKG